MAGIKIPYKVGKNSKSKARTQCKCLTCANPHMEKYENLTMLICGEEACYLDCSRCTERPNMCGYVERTSEAVMVG